MYSSLSYDPPKALKPVAVIAESAGVLLVHPSLPVKSVQEFTALAKVRPGALTYASAGHGSAIHMATELYLYMSATKMVHVPYRGSGPAMVDLVSGQVQVMFENIASALPFVNVKRVRPLGVTSLKRNPRLPDIPTIAESGVPVVGGSHESALKRNAVETAQWGKVIKAAGIRAD